MKLKFMKLFAIATLFVAANAISSSAHAKGDVCALDGTYIRHDTAGQARSQILRITGKRAMVYEQGLKMDRFGMFAKPLIFVGKPSAVVSYELKSTFVGNGEVTFDLVRSTQESTGYQGFHADCATGNLDHPSIGDWVRI